MGVGLLFTWNTGESSTNQRDPTAVHMEAAQEQSRPHGHPRTTTDSMPNRWRIAAAGVVMQIALGAVYAWSVFRNPAHECVGWSISEVTLTFTIAIFVLGFAAFAGGVWMRRVGPRRRRALRRSPVRAGGLSRQLLGWPPLVAVWFLRTDGWHRPGAWLHRPRRHAGEMVS